MLAPMKTQYDKSGPTLVKAMKKRQFDAYYCSTAEEAVEKVLELIPEGDVVSWGGVATVDQLGIKDRLRQRNQPLIDRDTAKTPDERMDMLRQALTCDTFLMSSNAISEDGQLVNIDGMGNRVAALCFGPKQVIVVAGMNKVAGDLDSAILPLPPTCSALTSRPPVPSPDSAATAPAPTAAAPRSSPPGSPRSPAASRWCWWAKY